MPFDPETDVDAFLNDPDAFIAADKIDSEVSGALKGKGKAFVDAAEKYGIDPYLLASISMHETGNGTSRAVNQRNNAAGIMTGYDAQQIREFPSVEDSIDFAARNLKKNYINQGLTTIPLIQRKYAPVGASNDPRGLNSDWVNGVSSFYKRFQSPSQQVAQASTNTDQFDPDAFLEANGVPSQKTVQMFQQAQDAQNQMWEASNANPFIQRMAEEAVRNDQVSADQSFEPVQANQNGSSADQIAKKMVNDLKTSKTPSSLEGYAGPSKITVDPETGKPVIGNTTPLAGILPRPSSDTPLAGVISGAENVAEGLFSPTNLVIAAATGGIGGIPGTILKSGAGMYFGKTMTDSAISQGLAASEETNPRKKAELYTESGLNALMAGLMATHALTARPETGGMLPGQEPITLETPNGRVQVSPSRLSNDLQLVPTEKGTFKIVGGEVGKKLVAVPLTTTEAQSAAALKGPDVLQPTPEGPKAQAPLLGKISPDTYERESGQPLKEGHVAYRDPVTLQVFDAPENASPEQLTGLLYDAQKENLAAEAKGKRQTNISQYEQGIPTQQAFVRDEQGNLIPRPKEELPVAEASPDVKLAQEQRKIVSMTQGSIWNNADQLEQVKRDLLGQHKKALSGALSFGGEKVSPLPDESVRRAIGAIDERIQQLRESTLEPEVTPQARAEEPAKESAPAPEEKAPVAAFRETPNPESKAESKSEPQSFPDSVKAAAERVPENGWFGPHKVLINHLWEAWRKEPGNNLSLEDFKAKAMQEIRKGTLSFSRADIPDFFTPKDLSDSKLQYGPEEYHFLNADWRIEEAQRRAIQAMEAEKSARNPPPVAEPPKSQEPIPEPAGGPTSIKNAVTDTERAQRGIQEANSLAQRTFPEVWDEAKSIADKDELAGENLVKELANKGRPISDVEDALLLREQVKHQNLYDDATRDFNEATRAGDEEAANRAKAVVLRERDMLQKIYEAGRNAGTETARGLNARKMVANRNYTLGRMLAEREASLGEKLTEEEKGRVQKEFEEIKDLQDKVDAEEKLSDEKRSKDALDQSIKDMKSEIRKEKATPKPPKSSKLAKATEKVVKFVDSQADAALKRIQARRTKLYTNPLAPLAHVADEAIIGASYLAHGIVNFAEWSKKMVGAIGEAVRPKLQEFYRQSKDYLEASSVIQTALEKMEARKDEGLKTLTPYVKRIAKEMVRTGIEDRDKLVDAVHEQVKSVFPDITNRQTRDAISGYGETSELAKDPASVKLRDLKGQLQQISKIEDMQKKIAPLKTGTERRTPSAEERALIKEVNKLKKMGGYTEIDPEKQLKSTLDSIKTRLQNEIDDKRMAISKKEALSIGRGPSPTDAEVEQLRKELKEVNDQYESVFGLKEEQRAQAAERALEKSIKDYEDRIKSGNLGTKQKGTQISSPKIDALRKTLDARREELQALRDAQNPKKTPQEISLQSAKTRAKNELAYYQDKLDRGDFSKPPKVPSYQPDAELNKLRADLARKKLAWQNENLKIEQKNRPAYQKGMDFVARTARAAFLSSPGIIGKLADYSLLKPVTGALEETAGAFWRRVLPQIAERAPYEGSRIRLGQEGAAIARGIIRGFREAKNVLLNHQGEIDVLHGDQRPQARQNLLYELASSTHAVLKNPLKNAVFERSLVRRMQYDAEHGVDINDPAIQARNSKLALDDANRAILQSKNGFAQWIDDGIRRGEAINPNTGKPDLGKVLVASLLKWMIPIKKVPANWFSEGVEYGLGLPNGLIRAVKAIREGSQNLNPQEADYIMRLLKKGTPGAALALFAFYQNQNFGGFFVKGGKKKDNQVPYNKVRIGSTNIPEQAMDSPIFTVMNTAATFAKMKPEGITPAVWASFMGMTDKLPAGRELSEIFGANAHSIGDYANRTFASRIVPGASSYAARLQDTNPITGLSLLSPEPQKRVPQNFGQELESRIPYLRQNVPTKEGADLQKKLQKSLGPKPVRKSTLPR